MESARACPQCLMKAASGPPPSAVTEGLPGAVTDIGDPAEIAKKLPQFEILEMLGRGGMGVVYKARQLQLDRVVALKILPPVDALSADFVARFTREARALAKLNHPNIVNVYDFGETGGLYYIVMEFVDGANLRQLLEARKLTPAEALAIVPKICDALQHAHEEGLVHRDIKPENLLIDKTGRVKIADFGLAKLLRREPLDMTLTLSGMALGTLRYMAPEQMDKPETVDHRADLYSLGVVIYEMLTGETPGGRFELPSQKAEVDVRLDQIVLHALEREPERRYQHASEVRDDVEKVTSKPHYAPASSCPDDSEPAKTKAGPRFSWWRAFGLLLLGWLAVGALWNWRTPGCLLGSLIMGGIVTEISIRRARLIPAWAEAWKKAGALAKTNLFTQYLTAIAIGFLLLINAMTIQWDCSLFQWNSLAKSRGEFEAEYQGKEYQLIRDLDAFKDQVPTTELSPGGENELRAGWHIWGKSSPFHPVMRWMSVIGSLLAGPVGLLLVFQQCFGAEHFSAFRINRAAWKPALALTGTLLASAICVYGGLWISSLFAGSGSRSTAAPVRATTQQVDAALKHWAAANGYAPGVETEWNLTTVPKGEIAAHAELISAWKPSPFDRWRMTWAGLRRASPHVAVQIVGTQKPAQSWVTFSANAVQIAGESGKSAWKSLSEAIAKSPDLDPSTRVLSPADRADDTFEGSADGDHSPWLLLCGFLGVAVLWITIRLRFAARKDESR